MQRYNIIVQVEKWTTTCKYYSCECNK